MISPLSIQSSIFLIKTAIYAFHQLFSYQANSPIETLFEQYMTFKAQAAATNICFQSHIYYDVANLECSYRYPKNVDLQASLPHRSTQNLKRKHTI